MYFKPSLVHTIFSAICITTVVCLKKDEYYCEKSSPCICISIQGNSIDLTGVNLTYNITTDAMLTYEPCPINETNPNVAVSI